MFLESTYFLIFFFAFFYLWIYISKFTIRHIFSINILGFLNLNIFIFQFVGLPFLFFQLFSDRAEDGITNKEIIFLVFLYTSLTILLLNVGYFLAKKLLGLNFNQYSFDSSVKKNRPLNRKLLLLGVICTSFSILYYYSQGFENLAITAILNNLDASDVAFARSSMTNNYVGGLHWIKFVTNDLFFFIIICLTILAFKNKLDNIFIYIAFLVVYIINLLVTTEKAPIIDFLLSIMILKYFFLNVQKLNIKKILIPVFSILLVLIFVYKTFMPVSTTSDVIYSVLSRTLGGQIQVAYYYIEYFPSYHSYLNGLSFPNPAGLLPFTNFPLTQAVHSWVHPELAKMGIVGSMPTMFWGELYTNFGVIGIIILTPIVGFILYIINCFFESKINSVLGLAFFVFLIFHFKNLALSSLSNYIFDLNLLFILVISITLRLNFYKNAK